MNNKQIGQVLGPLSFLLLIIFLPSSMAAPTRGALASIVWIAIWWISEAVPIAITSLMPLILFPLTGVMSLKQTSAPYSNPLIYLFLGGFILALAMEKWNLHRRVALNIIKLVGVKQQQLILGFILATGFLSMWISNTATTVMMLPIALSIINQDRSDSKEHHDFSRALILSLPYSASIGGMATLVGSPTNLIFADAVKKFYGVEIHFDLWMAIGLPIAALLLVACWLHLTRVAFKISNDSSIGSQTVIDEELTKLGKMSREEKLVLVVFSLVGLAWITRRYLIAPFVPAMNDTIIVLIGALALFIIPSSDKKSKLMDWQTSLKMPWGVLLLFGGAFAVASGFQASGLTDLIGDQLAALPEIPFILLLLIIVTVVNFTTEVTMNMATCTLMMPILASLALTLDLHPFTLMAGTCIAASCAFMLPIATAPNAVAFGSGEIKVKDMLYAGFLLNVLSIIIITAVVYFLMPSFWDLDVNSFPDSFKAFIEQSKAP